jgi:hypothetical protein
MHGIALPISLSTGCKRTLCKASRYNLGPTPLVTVQETATRVLARVNETSDNVCLTTPVGGMHSGLLTR